MKLKAQPIFLVEDNEVYLKTLETKLKEQINHNTEIRSFTSGEDCLKNMNMKPKIVVLDYFLDGSSPNAMNGLDVLKKIKKMDPDTMVLMLSNQDNIQVATDTMKYGAFDYVSKNENAFLRVENAIKNIESIITQRIAIKTGRQVRRVLIGWIILLVAIIIVLEFFFPELMSRNV
jgi:two-component system OmpR family response regulator